MRVNTHKETVAKLKATTEDGTKIEFKAEVTTNKEFYPVNEVDEKVNLMGLFKIMSEICKSGKDIKLLGQIIDYANGKNEIWLGNQTKLAEEFGVSRKHLSQLLKRAEEAKLLHKLDVGIYLLNPYKVLGESASKRTYKEQELIQVRWKSETGLITELELKQLIELSKHLELVVGLAPTEFNLSVASYYAGKHTITDKQRQALLKRN